MNEQERRLFAAMAMQGMLSAKRDCIYQVIAIEAVHCADALMKELDKKEHDLEKPRGEGYYNDPSHPEMPF